MRGIGTTLFGAFAFLLSASGAGAADLRVLSVGSVQIAAKALAADFTKSTGNQARLTIVAPSEIGRKLASAAYDMVICSVPAMAALDQAGALRAGSRLPLARVGIGVMVREGAPLPDVSTPAAFKQTLLAARSIVHGDPTTPNQSGVVTMKILAKAGVLDAIRGKARAANLAEGFAMVAKGEVGAGAVQSGGAAAGRAARRTGSGPAAGIHVLRDRRARQGHGARGGASLHRADDQRARAQDLGGKCAGGLSVPVRKSVGMRAIAAPPTMDTSAPLNRRPMLRLYDFPWQRVS